MPSLIKEAVLADWSGGGTSAALAMIATIEAAAQPKSTALDLGTLPGLAGVLETGLIVVG
jgi:hypothetical protein